MAGHTDDIFDKYNVPTILPTLKTVPFFTELSHEQLTSLVDRGRIERVGARQIVFREGDESGSMYVILQGKVRVFRQDEDGNEVELLAFGVGEYFGEMALLSREPRSATVASLEPATFFVLGQADFMSLLLESGSQIIYRAFAALTSRIRESNEKLFSQEMSRQRLASEMEIERHRSVAQMVAGVAHELNTPLGIINTASDMIKNRLTSEHIAAFAQNPDLQEMLEDVVEATTLIARNIARAHKLVQDFKKISVNQITDVRQTVRLAPVVTETVDLFKISARKARMEIVIRDSLPPHAVDWDGYPGSLTQVILNLLTNAQRYAYPDGQGGAVEIEMGASQFQSAPAFTLTVRDFGQGIPPAHLSRVFDPFFTTGRSQGGTGLGLSIVYNIVTALLKGIILVSSEPGKGTTFTITFPQRVPDEHA